MLALLIPCNYAINPELNPVDLYMAFEILDVLNPKIK